MLSILPDSNSSGIKPGPIQGSRSAIEWIIRQYQVTTDKASGIINDPNQWGVEHGKPRYILDLLQKVITISVRTVEITEALPGLGIKGGEQ